MYNYCFHNIRFQKHFYSKTFGIYQYYFYVQTLMTANHTPVLMVVHATTLWMVSIVNVRHTGKVLHASWVSYTFVHYFLRCKLDARQIDKFNFVNSKHPLCVKLFSSQIFEGFNCNSHNSALYFHKFVFLTVSAFCVLTSVFDLSYLKKIHSNNQRIFGYEF